MGEPGQINPETQLGKALIALVEKENVKTILEVGTWNGRGSTVCLVLGLLKVLEKQPGEEVHFYSIESNLEFHKKAYDFWLLYCVPFLHLIYGSLHKNGMMTREEIESHPKFKDLTKLHYQLWYDQDVKDYEKAPLIDSSYLPKKVDMVVLDGGEFSGYADWSVVKQKNPRIVVLDDTYVIKNNKVLRELESDSSWQKRLENTERNGWAIFVKKE